jgi:hypothetical protein
MQRTRVTITPPSTESADEQALAETWQSQSQWLDQLLGLQTTWWTSCAALQAAYLRQCTSAPFALAPWMVWQNGTEQLA